MAGSLPADTTLDGELVVVDSEGRVDFDRMRRRGFGQPSPGRLLFVVFDVLALAGREVIGRRCDVRRTTLADLALDGPAAVGLDAGLSAGSSATPPSGPAAFVGEPRNWTVSATT